MTSLARDNLTLSLKTSLRRKLLRLVDAPVVCETHGGYGVIWEQVYRAVPQGVVFEKDERKAEFLAEQRPTWAVYEADCEAALRAGAGAHLSVNFLDCDPYGEPWPVLDAFFTSERPWPETLAIAVQDGLRLRLGITGAWSTGSMTEAVARYGNSGVFDNYLAVCQEKLTQIAGQRGYKLTRWAGYYCGNANKMTHYGALFTRSGTYAPLPVPAQ